jgi:hypothetical protein
MGSDQIEPEGDSSALATGENDIAIPAKTTVKMAINSNFLPRIALNA